MGWPPDITEVENCEEPGGKHFVGWAFAAGVASATAVGGLQNQLMTCATFELSLK